VVLDENPNWNFLEMTAGRPKGQPRTGGRQVGTPNKATLEIKELARVHGPAGIARLAELAFETPPVERAAVNELRRMFAAKAAPFEIARYARNAFQARSDATCVAAIKELFDRGYGKAPQPHDGDGQGGAIRWIVGWEK
jgi:hypothetical protein